MVPSIASSLISGIFGNVQQQGFFNQQQQENERVFQQNRQLAQEQNAMNIAQWNRENAYNLPQNQMKRLRDAGINPALAFGNGVSGLTSANSPTMSAGYPNSPVDATLGGHRQTIGDIVQNSLNLAHQKASIDNLNSNTGNTNEDTAGKKIDNEWKSALYSTNVKEALSRIGVNGVQQSNILANTEKVYKEFGLIDVNISQIRNSISNDNERLALEKIETKLAQEMQGYNIRESLSRMNVNDSQADSITKKLSHEILLLTKQADLTTAQVRETLSKEMLNILSQEKVINDADKVALENMILSPQAIKAQDFTNAFTNKDYGNIAVGMSNCLDLMYQFLGAISGVAGTIIPG